MLLAIGSLTLSNYEAHYYTDEIVNLRYEFSFRLNTVEVSSSSFRLLL